MTVAKRLTVPMSSTDFIYHCEPRRPQLCTQYRESSKQQLDEFLILCGGTPAQFDADGTARVVSIVKGEARSSFVKPGSWVRCLGRGQFSAVSARYFEELYKLVGTVEDQASASA